MVGWVGGWVVYMENNAILSEDWIGFSDRSSVAIRKSSETLLKVGIRMKKCVN